ncbi:MAG: SycD/LcrH family type III secretion system chaperone [Puniceicoccales bacterium]|jgi:type III secretion system low calcium response chaperone LcrH/SycD|nr:SycD/LcrH family type III secretion system chaperone [Puniceicoccales bacterium]
MDGDGKLKIDKSFDELLTKYFSDKDPNVALYEKIPGISDINLEAAYGIGYDLFQKKKYDKAHSIFYFLCILNHFQKKYWKALALTCYMMRKYEESRMMYFTAFMLDPTDIELVSAMADCSVALGDADNAKTFFEITCEMGENYGKNKRLCKRAKTILDVINDLANNDPNTGKS